MPQTMAEASERIDARVGTKPQEEDQDEDA